MKSASDGSMHRKKRLIQNTSLNTDLSTEDVAAACVYSGRMRLPLPSGLDERSCLHRLHRLPVCLLRLLRLHRLLLYPSLFLPH